MRGGKKINCISQKNPSTTIFKSGYKLEKYSLTPEEIAVPFDPQIDPEFSLDNQYYRVLVIYLINGISDC